MIEVREYLAADGVSPYGRWFDRLNAEAAAKVGACTMALTRDFKETIQARVRRDRAFREALLQEGVQSLLAGDIDAGKAVLRDYINATIGFEALGALTDKTSKSLMRMFAPRGNPQARNLFAIIAHLQEREGVHLEVRAVR